MTARSHVRNGQVYASRRQAAFARTRDKAKGKGKGKRKHDAVLVSRPEDVSYLTGFTGEDSLLLLGKGWAVLLTDGRYDEAARAECPDLDIAVHQRGMLGVIGETLQAHKIRRLYVQSEHVTVQWRDRLVELLDEKNVRGIAGLTGPLRSVKDDAEIATTRRSIRVAEQALKALLAEGARAFVGKSERDVAARLDFEMRCRGASRPSFETIVAAGAHGSMPHYRPDDTKIRAGDPVLIDWGAMVDGYCSDLTRMVFTGRIPPKIAEIYKVVRRAQQAGIDAIRSGVTCRSVDAAARSVIEDAGFGDAFVHGLGHGIGREIHEEPRLGRQPKDRLSAGMIVTVEPGIYLPGVGGVRIEDDVLVTREGPRKLTTLARGIKAMTVA